MLILLEQCTSMVYLSDLVTFGLLIKMLETSVTLTGADADFSQCTVLFESNEAYLEIQRSS